MKLFRKLMLVWFAALSSLLIAQPLKPGSMAAEYGINPQLHPLLFGEVMPAGWLRHQMIVDLDSGFAGNLQKIAPRTAASGIFGYTRNSPGKLHDAADQKGPLFVWWNGETEGNWRCGNIMMGLLTGLPARRKEVDARVTEILNTQDADGYLGIYSREIRWPDGSSENGELWTQACLLRGLLAYYEATGNPEILASIEKAVKLTCGNYSASGKNAFGACDLGGISHGLMFTDVLSRLYEITGNRIYRDFGIHLYRNFSDSCSKLFNDLSLSLLLDPTVPFDDHGVHDYEHLRVVLWNAYVTGDPVLLTASASAFAKAMVCITPAGGPIGNEWISGQKGHPDIGYEGCSQSEWMTSCLFAAQMTGHAAYCDFAENTFFNAAQGSRLPDGKALMYLSSDNRPEVTGKERNKFSPSHEDVANCCAPNFTKITPLFISSMWMHADDGLAATLYGPCELNTRVNGVPVSISEETSYPFSLSIRFKVHAEKKGVFTLRLRTPAWATAADISCPGAEITHSENWTLIKKEWGRNDTVELILETLPCPVPAINKEFYIRYGPLIYARAIPSVIIPCKDYPLTGFHDYALSPADTANHDLAFSTLFLKNEVMKCEIVKNPRADLEDPWRTSPIRLRSRFYNMQTTQVEYIELVPMGSGEALLRQVTFPAKNEKENVTLTNIK